MPPTSQPIAGFISPGVTKRNPENYFDAGSAQNVSRVAQGIPSDQPQAPAEQPQQNQGDSGGGMPWYWPFDSEEAWRNAN